MENAFTEDDRLKMVEQIKDIVEIEPDVSLYKDCLYPWSEIYKYMTPDETWASLRGRGWYFLICPHCLKQIDFFTLILN